MKQKVYDVFISYHREDGFETASLIAEKLRNVGYSVFFDVESLRTGKFNEQLYRVIENCKDFIIVLPKDGLKHCVNETDWVKQEIIFAMKREKNIIPVELREFQWPEIMPLGLEGLKHYQSITVGDPNFFNAAIDKIKSYLKSKRSFIWHKYKTYFLSLLILLLFTTSIFLWEKYEEQQRFMQICIDQTNLMSLDIGIINDNLNIAKSAYNEWDRFKNELSKSNPQNVSKVKQDFYAFIENKKRSIQPINLELKITDEELSILSRHGIKISGITTFYSMVLARNIEATVKYLNQLQVYANGGPLFELYDKFAYLSYQALETIEKADYYDFLGFLTTMPKDVYKDFYKVQQNLNNFSEIPLNLSFDEYKFKGDAMMKKIDNIMIERRSANNAAIVILEKSQNRLNQLEEIIDNNMEETAKKEIFTRKQNIQKLFDDIIEDQKQSQKMEKEMEEFMRNMIEKCKLTPDDDQYLMWGGINRIATYMEETVIRRIEYERINKLDTATRYDLLDMFEIKYSLTIDEILLELITFLDKYAHNFPETKDYVPAVKQFYTDVKNGKQILGGIIVVGTKDDIPHPIFKIGDIILDRKGKKINSIEDYKSATKNEGNDSVTFLRLSNGKLQKHVEIIPKTNVLTAFLLLKEE